MSNNFIINKQSFLNATGLALSVKRILILFLVCLLFLVKSSFCQVTEGFEENTITSTTGGTGMPSAYGTGSYILGSGTWVFNLAMKGSTGYHGGSGSCALKSATGSSIVSPTIANAGVATINFWASNTTG